MWTVKRFVHTRKGRAGRVPRLLACSLLSVMVSLTACKPSASVKATITGRADRPDTQIAVEASKDLATIEIVSASGIGSAGFEIGSGPRPAGMEFRLHLKGLEQFTFSYGGTQITASLSSGRNPATREEVQLPGSNAGQAQPLSPDSPYWMRIDILPADGAPEAIPLQSGVILVHAPEDWSQQQARSFAVAWVDFFR